MLSEKFKEVIQKEGVVSLVSWTDEGTTYSQHLEFIFGSHRG